MTGYCISHVLNGHLVSPKTPPAYRRPWASLRQRDSSAAKLLAACRSQQHKLSGGGTKTVFKLAFNQTEDHPQYVARVELGKKLEEATDGRYSIRVYPNEQLGGQADVVQNLSNGTVEMMWIAASILEGYNPDFVVFNLPYMFDSTEAQTQVLSDTDLLSDLYTSLEASKSITVLTGVNAGTRNVYNSKRPIRTPADMQGLKVRVQQSDSQVAMIEAMGATASPMNFGDVYSAMQTGVLDGAENNEAVYHSMKHDEVAKYYSYTRHLLMPDYLLINSKTLAGMDDADREALLGLLPEVQTMANDGMVEFANKSIAESEAIGAQFNDDVDVAAFKALVEPQNQASVNQNEARIKLYEGVQAANQAHPAK
ncbi:MAG: TRAP transporter substrate-binding protein [Propionibacteriaceae bacterium]|nr:TRAP transporter substrate-binding protein [Propionibacteriaceae bacterium]